MFVAPRGWRLELCFFDVFHVVWLGIARDVVASLLVDLMENNILDAGDMDRTLQREFTFCLKWCRRERKTPPRFRLTKPGLGRSKTTDFPELASYYKAMDVKVYTQYLAYRVENILGGTQRTYYRYLVTVMWSLVHCMWVFDHGGVSHKTFQPCLPPGCRLPAHLPWP